MATLQRPQESAEDRKGAGHGAKPEAVRERVILALLSERSILATAKRANVSERSVRRWLEDPEFKAEYEKAR